MSAAAELLDRLSTVHGIRGSVLVSAGDGLIVAESLITALENRLIKWRPNQVSGGIPI